MTVPVDHDYGGDDHRICRQFLYFPRNDRTPGRGQRHHLVSPEISRIVPTTFQDLFCDFSAEERAEQRAG